MAVDAENAEAVDSLRDAVKDALALAVITNPLFETMKVAAVRDFVESASARIARTLRDRDLYGQDGS